ncbi:MAG: hypothetical protein JJT87_12250 [Halomonas sp.]|nr:hypothetical protein [Halomonas sp.]MCC5902680.1 hypothetical protein [Halomonas sp.]
MREITLSQPSTVCYDWFESDNRQVHKLWVQVDSYNISDEYIAWVDGDALREAIEFGELPHGTEPNWFHVHLDDDEETIAGILKSIETNDPDISDSPLRPLQRLIEHQVWLKLFALRQSGQPPAKPLKKIKLDPVAPDPTLHTPQWFRAEECHDGVLMNPILPSIFEGDQEPHELTLVEKSHWWNRPYIVTRQLEVGIESYDGYASRALAVGVQPMTEHEWAENQEKIRAKWFDRFPSGQAFHVRCLDGRTGNTPTWWGDADSIEGALEIVRRNRPMWVEQEPLGGSRHDAH